MTAEAQKAGGSKAGDSKSARAGATTPGGQPELSRDLGLFTITMIGVGAMIGAGIFVLTGEAAGVAGPALILSFALNGVITLLTAMVYAELGSAIPEAGGGYLWIKEGLPGANAFLAGWMSWFAHSVAGALYALGFGAFVFELARILGVPWESVGLDFILAKKTFGIFVAVAFAYINFRGASETGLAGNIVTLAKLAVIGVFCAFGIKYMFFPEAVFDVGGTGGMGTEQLTPFIPEQTGWLGILSAMGLTFIAFEGYEIIVQSGEEVKDPGRNIPKAVFWSLAIVIPIYMLVAFVLVGATHTDQLLEALRSIGIGTPEGVGPDSANWMVLRHVGELGLAQAAAQFIPYGAVLILIGGVLSTMSALNATTFSSTRVSFAMGRDRNLPDGFAEIHDERRTPHIALFWTAVLIVAMVAFIPITTVAAAADIMFLLLFIQVNVAVITLRKKHGDKLAYGFLMPFFPVIPAVAIVAKLGLALFMFDHYPVAWVYVVAWLVVGFGIYRFWAAHRRPPEEELPVVAEEAPVEASEHSVLIGVAEPRAGRALTHLGARMAEALGSEVILLHVVAVPRQLPLRSGQEWVGEAREMMSEIQETAAKWDVPVRSVIRLAHRPADAIIRAAADRNTEYLVMGWHGPKKETPSRRSALIGRNIDRVIKQSNSHAIIYETHASERDVEEVPDSCRILVPLSEPDLAPLALGVAASLIPRGSTSGEIIILHLSSGELSDEDKRSFRREVVEQVRPDEDEGEEEENSGEGEEGREGREAEDPVEEAEPEALLGENSSVFFDFRTIRSSLVDDVVELSGDFTRMVVPVPPETSLFRRRVIGETAREIVDRADCPVVLTRPHGQALRFNVQTFFQFFRELEEAVEETGKPDQEADEVEEEGED